MKNAIILHGKPSKEEYYNPQAPSSSNFHWIPWLQKQLMTRDIYAATPEVPWAYDPQWDLWCKEVERYDITPETVLVGHSCGAGFWVRYLSENKDLRVGKVILVAPSLGYSWENGEDSYGKNFFAGLIIDSDLIHRTKGVTIFNSDDDHPSIHQAVKEIRDAIPDTEYQEFHLGHFIPATMNSPEFPELLEACTE